MTDVPATFDLETLQWAYRERDITPRAVVETALSRAESDESRNVWIDRYDERARRRAADLASVDPAEYPLYGVPFAVKDNIDVAGRPTTAACPAYEYVPEDSATVVERLADAGAVLLGKTNMDQFATGLVGTRSPYGICRNAHDRSLISGGSSSGSGVAVARGQVSFALGTDTAGSGRVPAALNGVVGYKPTRGLVSTDGVVPACRTLDCVSVFATTVADAARVGDLLVGYDDADPYSRPEADGLSVTGTARDTPTIGVFERTEHFGDDAARTLFEKAVRGVEDAGATVVTVPEAPFREAAELLYGGPWVAERFSAVGDFLEDHPDEALDVTRDIITEGADYSAVDSFEAMYALQERRRRVQAVFEDVDFLLTPTTGTTYTVDAVREAPKETNATLGHYTDYVNLLDLCAVAVPGGTRPDGAHLGVTLVGPADHDASTLSVADRLVPEDCRSVPTRTDE
ncbi:allophanate hydrolase [Halomicroarcula sp. GCM10025817]|uniref:allophanate hydrolase n=1 Tax=Haloarcula TaxID=2237 RepID=UPI0023E7DC62|nr:allophanate hydrolase [Halomicroarcula sp. SYNS111]